MRFRVVALPIVAAWMLFALVACGAGDEGGSSSASVTSAPDVEAKGGSAGEVVIRGFAFEPEDLKVSAGTEVRWVNRDDADHSIKDPDSEAPPEESSALGEGDEFRYTFEKPGEYDYVCGIHQYMTGTVTVT